MLPVCLPAKISMNGVLFLTEAGPEIGLGHVTRMRAVEAYLAERNVETALVVRDISSPDSCEWLADFSWLPDCRGFDCVVVDSYLADRSKYEILRREFSRVVAIDDYNRIVYPADLIINPNVYFSSVDYSSQSAVCVGGPCYIILCGLFRAARPSSGPTGGVLVTLGGSDCRRLLSRFGSLSETLPLTLIVPEEAARPELKRLFPLARVLGRLDEADMLDNFLRARVVVPGCGQSLHELAYLAKNTIGIWIDDDQTGNCDYYVASGFLKQKITWDDPHLEDKVTELALKFLSSHEQRTRPAFDPERNMENYFRHLALKDNHAA